MSLWEQHCTLYKLSILISLLQSALLYVVSITALLLIVTAVQVTLSPRLALDAGGTPPVSLDFVLNVEM